MNLVLPMGMDAFAVEATQVVDNSTAVSPTAATVQPTDGTPPAKAAVVTIEDQPARFYANGSTATAALGHSIPADSSIILWGIQQIKNFSVIAEATDCKVTITYFR